MNARVLRQARFKRRRQWGFVAAYAAERRPGLPVRVANAHARFEQEARAALREWLMV